MPTISECIFTVSEVTYFSLENSDFFTTLHLESIVKLTSPSYISVKILNFKWNYKTLFPIDQENEKMRFKVTQ